MLEDIQGKVAWVTGAGTGIGESGAIKPAAVSYTHLTLPTTPYV